MCVRALQVAASRTLVAMSTSTPPARGRGHEPGRSEDGFVLQLAVMVGLSVLSGVLIAGLALPFAGLAGFGVRNVQQMVEELPLELAGQPSSERTRILTREGKLLATLYDENRIELQSLDDVAPVMRNAIVSIEDDRFFEHGALDVKGTIRALVANQAGGKIVQGGSSITQQLVKLTLLEQAGTDEERAAATADTYGRKLAELRYALWVEEERSKNEILLDYLNIAYFGDSAYGIEAAAQHYYGVSADQLDLRQAAMLAGVVKNPSLYDPTNNPRESTQRRNVVLDRMAQLGEISGPTAREVSQKGLGLELEPTPNGCISSTTQFFCDYVRAWLLSQPTLGETVEDRERLLFRGGLTIRTTLDQRFQREADRAVSATVEPVDQVIGALAMVEPGTGEVRAIAQSRPMGNNRQQGETFVNYLVPPEYTSSAGFQPGSTFKAFVLAAAIEQGIPLDTKIYSPRKMSIPQDRYEDSTCPRKNLAGSFSVRSSTTKGMMDLYTGTQYSVNTFFAQLELRTGLCAPWSLANEVGLSLPESGQIPVFTLGVSDVSPLGMAEAYATFAARGRHCAAIPVTQVLDRNGNEIEVADAGCERVLPAHVADAVNDVLEGVVTDRLADDYELDQPAAGKTGTTNDNRSVWFVGYTPNLVTAAMLAGINTAGAPDTLVGKVVDGEVLSDASGAGTAAPLWHDAMSAVQPWLPDKDFRQPDPAKIAGQPVQVPSLGGVTPRTAVERLRMAGLNPIVQAGQFVDSGFTPGTVAYTRPNAFSTASSGDTVTVFLSDGTPEVTPSPTPTASPFGTPSPFTSPFSTPSPTASPSPFSIPSPTASPSPTLTDDDGD